MVSVHCRKNAFRGKALLYSSYLAECHRKMGFNVEFGENLGNFFDDRGEKITNFRKIEFAKCSGKWRELSQNRLPMINHWEFL